MTKQLSFVPFVLLSSLIIFTLVTLFSASNFAQAKSAKLREADFVDAHCTGEIEYEYPLPFKVLDFSGNLNDFRQGEERKHSHSIFLFFNAP